VHPAASSLRARLTFALMTFLLLGLPVPARPGDQPTDRATLKGLTTIMVVVERLTPEAERDGLTKEQLRTDVEVRLRKAGITVTSSVEEAYLYLNVFTVKGSSELYAYHIRLEFNQEVILKRNRNVSLPAPTWSLDLGGTVGAKKLHEVRDDVADMVDKFINAYLEQNPKP
jgi:hypothetical protein